MLVQVTVFHWSRRLQTRIDLSRSLLEIASRTKMPDVKNPVRIEPTYPISRT